MRGRLSLMRMGYQHKTVNHSAGEYASDEDGEGFCEIHSNTIEGFWSLLRSWLRPQMCLDRFKLGTGANLTAIVSVRPRLCQNA